MQEQPAGLPRVAHREFADHAHEGGAGARVPLGTQETDLSPVTSDAVEDAEALLEHGRPAPLPVPPGESDDIAVVEEAVHDRAIR